MNNFVVSRTTNQKSFPGLLPVRLTLPLESSCLGHLHRHGLYQACDTFTRERNPALSTSHLSSLSSLRPPTSRPVTTQNSVPHLSLVSKHTSLVVIPPFSLHLKSTSSQHIQTCSSLPTLTRTFLPCPS